ncbi:MULTISPECIES: four helix bundle protein [unclassified Carboxylicivirga]|uniref:four helix bundle protein n=1 Tax=Carboxylicivirga TaxID=1628153 RepID=UPI003D33F19E
MYTYGFEKLEVWQLARRLVKDIYVTTHSFPESERYGLTNQLRRASVSISSNIAEGNSRSSSKDRARFIEISYSSLTEVLNQLILANDLSFIAEQEILDYRRKIDELANKINSFHKSIVAI